MQSHTTKRFRQMFQALPDAIQSQSKDAYRLFLANPRDPSVRFKQIKSKPLYSARVSDQYRAVAVEQGNDLYWSWIGPIVSMKSSSPATNFLNMQRLS